MIGRGEIERVPASRDHADVLIAQARHHLSAVQAIVAIDSVGAYQLLYDSARKALAAVLENQGLRATSRGGHIAVLDAVSPQLDPPLGPILRPFDRLRRRRNQAEYPALDSPRIDQDLVLGDLPKVREIVDAAEKVLDQMSPY
jgi:hypothetical protein